MTKQSKRLTKFCVICGKAIKVFIYPDKTMRGGHYFGKMPIYSEAEIARASKSSINTITFIGRKINVLANDPKAHGYE